VDVSDFNEVLAKFTFYGDNDLSGTVDATDYGLFLQGKNGGGTGWAFGDYDYSGGRPDATDYGLLLQGKTAYKNFGAL
jgi:hypothetical protein